MVGGGGSRECLRGVGGMLRGVGRVWSCGWLFAVFLLSESKSVNTEPCHQVALQSFFGGISAQMF